MSFAKGVLTIPIKDWNKIGLLFVLHVVSFVTYKRKNRQSLNLSMTLVMRVIAFPTLYIAVMTMNNG